MGFRITCTERRRKLREAFTLVEVMVASALGLLLTTAVLSLCYFTSRSFAAMTNYTDMALASRMALDQMSRDIRQQRLLTAYATNAISLQDANSNTLQYIYNPGARTLVSVSGGRTNTYLTQCDSLQFWIYQHTPISNSFTCYSAAVLTNARLVQVTWSCSAKILGLKVNTEVTESASIALRNH
ncbi:MAG TPA: prepilin-type N-terminal cleavage/methylation domain-containing protein [Verrucomicrobiae bacterium]|nr:prepilin-type N-terminal cleavage/methylation domain-containing protein [Verrucomicrobiae bacterium]